MEVRRLPRNYAGGFERIPNRAIRDTDLSLPALGLLVRLLGDGDRYETIDEMADAYAKRDAETGKAVRGFGRDAYRQAGLELQKAGHLERTNVSAGYRKIETRTVVKAENGTKGATSTTPQAVADMTSGDDQDGTSDRLPLKPSATSPAETGSLGTSNRLPSQPSPISPAETGVCPGEIADGLSPSLPIQTYFQTSDPLLTSPEQAADDADDRTAGEGEGNLNNHRDGAARIIAALPGFLRPGSGHHERVQGRLAELLGHGWPPHHLESLLKAPLPANTRTVGGVQLKRLPEPAPYRAERSTDAADKTVPAPDALAEITEAQQASKAEARAAMRGGIERYRSGPNADRGPLAASGQNMSVLVGSIGSRERLAPNRPAAGDVNLAHNPSNEGDLAP